jgi:hypothetical protein
MYKIGRKLKSENTNRKLTIESLCRSMFVEILAEKKAAIYFIIEEDSGCYKQKLLFVMFASNNIV